MKKLLTLFVAFFVLLQTQAQNAPTKVIPANSIENNAGYISSNLTLSKDTVWLLDKVMYVTNNAVLTIQPGTIIKGSGRGSVVITRGAQINARGTRTAPIVFTSAKAKAERRAGDWGGIVILGKAENNATFKSVKSNAEIEGGVNDVNDNAVHGGGATPNNADNSGVLTYARIEYAGIAFSNNNEINSLTMGSVGSGTQIEYVQCSFGGDDHFEWFGGSVNAKWLVSYGATDDDLDTDFGYKGNVQFAYILRQPDFFDGAGDSNGFETDNNGGGTYIPPYTQPTFSNVTFVGPRANTATPNTRHNRAVRIRRNSRQLLANSILTGSNNAAILLEGRPTALVAKSPDSTALFLNNILVAGSNGVSNSVTSASVSGPPVNSVGTLDSAAAVTFNEAPASTLLAYLLNTTRNNDTTITLANLLLNSAYGSLSSNTNPTPNAMPMTNSPANTGAVFTNSRLSGAFFDKVAYRGAFGATNWMTGWTNFRPDTSDYVRGLVNSTQDLANVAGFEAVLYPNPASNNAVVEISLEKSLTMNVQLFDAVGREVLSYRNQRFAEGRNTLTLDLSKVSSGLYFVRFFSNDLKAQKTLNLSVSK